MSPEEAVLDPALFIIFEPESTLSNVISAAGSPVQLPPLSRNQVRPPNYYAKAMQQWLMEVVADRCNTSPQTLMPDFTTLSPQPIDRLMVVHQLKRDELADIWLELEKHPRWIASLSNANLSAGLLLEIVPGGRRGSTLVKRRGVCPFLFFFL